MSRFPLVTIYSRQIIPLYDFLNPTFAQHFWWIFTRFSRMINNPWYCHCMISVTFEYWLSAFCYILTACWLICSLQNTVFSLSFTVLCWHNGGHDQSSSAIQISIPQYNRFWKKKILHPVYPHPRCIKWIYVVIRLGSIFGIRICSHSLILLIDIDVD